MSALVLHLTTGLLLGLGWLAWRVLRRLVVERAPGLSASRACSVAQGLFVLSLVLPTLVRALRALPRRPLVQETAAAAGPTGEAGATVDGFVLLGRSVTGALPDELWAAMPLLLVAALLPPVLVHAHRTARDWWWLRGVVARSRTVHASGRVVVLATEEIATPFSTVALGRAHVVLPATLLQRRADLALALRHEIHHHRRRDVHWAVLLDALRVAFAWNPAVRAWASELADWQERACDAELVQRGACLRAYTGCLLRVAEDSLSSPIPVASAAMAHHGGRGVLKRRIEMLLDQDSRSSRLGPGGLALLTLVGGLLVAGALTAAAATAGLPAAATATAAAVAAPTSPPQTTSLGVGTLAPDISFTDGPAATTSLAELRGQVVVLAFWAEWCRFCNDSVTALRELESDLDGERLAIVGVSVDGTREGFERFVERHELSWPQHHSPKGWDGQTPRAYGLRALPLHVVLDREGRVAGSGVVLAQLRPTIESLIEQGGGS